jgi:hypothetical protein
VHVLRGQLGRARVGLPGRRDGDLARPLDARRGRRSLGVQTAKGATVRDGPSPGFHQRFYAREAITYRGALVVRARDQADWLLAVLVDDDEIPVLKPIGVVHVEGAPEIPLVINEFVLVISAFESVSWPRNEALADLDSRKGWPAPVGQRSSNPETQIAVISLEDLEVFSRGGVGDGYAVPLQPLDDLRCIVVELIDGDFKQGSARRRLPLRNVLVRSHLDPATDASTYHGSALNLGTRLESMECRCRYSDDPVRHTNCSQIASSNNPVHGVMADIQPIRDLFDRIPSLLGHGVTCIPLRYRSL